MKRLASSSDRSNKISDLIDGRTLDSGQLMYPYETMRALQMHTSLLKRLQLDQELEGHLGCVNTLAWNSTGSLLVSGSDDTRVNVWDYDSQKLVHSVDTGHTANIFCTKFLPESGDDLVVSGAGDSEVRLHRLSRSNGIGGAEPSAVFRCHSKRVKKLAVEDGNPHMIWSASEDGTLRQHDLREGVVCGIPDRECRNVLLDLRNGKKKSLSDTPRQCLALKSCAINPVRPHQILVGGSDAFARLYDRRMLPPLSAHQQTPPCVCYYCPVHLSDYTRSALHLTHVAFSPDGRDVLLSYSGEHVYLMDAYNGEDVSAVYNASHVSKWTVLVPLQAAQLAGVVSHKSSSSHRQKPSFQDCTRFFNEARSALDESNFFLAIESCSEVIDAGGTCVDSSLRHDCLCVRARAFLKRGWKNDMHMAIRDANQARLINPMSPVAHHILSEALSQLSRHKDALEFGIRASHLDPSDESLLEHVSQIRYKIAAAEDPNSNRNNTKRERRSSRIRSLREFFFRTDPDQSDSSDENRRTDRDESDIEDDMEMEMEIEMSVAGESEQDTESLGPSSVNLRLRRKNDSARGRRSNVAASTSDVDPVVDGQEEELVMDMRQRYVGHCNTGTDIKQASFLGERGEFVASGSDDGRWFIWEKKTGRVVKILSGDENVVNCVQSHPYDCAVATSGIDNTIKLWTPRSKAPKVDHSPIATTEALRIMSENQQSMRRQREIGLPIELLQRIRGVEGAPFECTQS